MSAIENTVEEVQDTSELDNFLEEWNERVRIDQLVCNWHVNLYLATGVHLPWRGDIKSVYCTQEDYDRETRTSTINVEKTRKLLAKVQQYAVSQHYKVVKPMDEDDDEFKAVITINENPEIKITYIANRTVVCTPIKEKVYVPATVVPAKFEEKTVGYDCEKISFLAYNTDDDES